jgi:WD40 repeat protein
MLAQEQSDRAAEQAHSASRLRWLAASLAVILLLAIGAAWLAAVRGQEAQANANFAATKEADAVAEAEQRATAQVVADEERDAAVNAEATAVAAGIRADEQREAALTAEAVAVQERQTAEAQTRLAISRELAAAALNNLSEDQERALLLALQALAQAHTQEAEDALHRTAQELRLLRILDAPGKSPFVALSPDGRLLITSGANGATVWDAAAGTIIYELNVGHYINRAAFSPDGTLLILPYENTSEENPEGYLEPSAVSIIDAETGEELLTFLAHNAWVQDVSFSSDGSLFATASGDGTVKVWDLAATLAAGEGKERLTITSDTFFWIVYFSPDSTRLATTNDDGDIQVWDARSGEELLHLNAETYSLAFSPDGTRLVSGSWTGMLNVYDALSGERLSSILAHDNMVMYVMFSPDGTRVATTSDDSTVKVWAYSKNNLSPLLTLTGHKGKTTTAEFSPDGERLISGSSESSGGDITVRIWDISPDGILEPVFYPHEVIVNGLVFSPDGDQLVTAGADGNARIWDAASGLSRHTLSGHDWVWRVAYSPDGSLLATAGRDAKVKLWDAISGQEVFTLIDHVIQDESEFFRGVLGVAFSPDGKRLATAGGDGNVRIWDVAVGKELFSLETQAKGEFGQIAMDVSFSPDGRWIAAAINNWADAIGSYGNGNIKVWDATTGELLWNVGGEAEKTYMSITFSPGSERLAAGSLQGQATIWRLPESATGTPAKLVTIQASNSFVFTLNFNPDGTRLAVAHMDGMGVWDTSTGEFLQTFPHQGGVMEASYSPNGKRLATAGFDGFGRLFITDVDELIALARARLTRSLTEAECQEYLHMETCPTDP